MQMSNSTLKEDLRPLSSSLCASSLQVSTLHDNKRITLSLSPRLKPNVVTRQPDSTLHMHLPHSSAALHTNLCLYPRGRSLCQRHDNGFYYQML